MAFDLTLFFTFLIAAGLFYIAAAIMCASLFGRKVKKWSWLNLEYFDKRFLSKKNSAKL